jgi:hypothetical protein
LTALGMQVELVFDTVLTVAMPEHRRGRTVAALQEMAATCIP